MDVRIIAGGSGGNCIAVWSGSTTILVDVGLPKTKIEQLLIENGITPGEIAAIFLTHAHKDHVQGLPLAAKYRIPVYASEGTWKTAILDGSLQHIIEEDGIYFPPIGVFAFRTYHDAYDSRGFTIEDASTKAAVCLDTGKVTDEMLEAMSGSEIIIIEANHEPNMVELSNYPISVQARILSDIGHLSNEQCAEAVSKLVRGRGERIMLTHLSRMNNMRALAEAEVKRALWRRGLQAGKHYFLEVV